MCRILNIDAVSAVTWCSHNGVLVDTFLRVGAVSEMVDRLCAACTVRALSVTLEVCTLNFSIQKVCGGVIEIRASQGVQKSC